MNESLQTFHAGICAGWYISRRDHRLNVFVFSACVLVTSNAYVENGKTKQVEDLLTSAKAQMKEMSQKYSDYEHYSNLKEYFTSVSAFFDFCKSPKGSYEQAIETMNDYRNTARELKNDLAFIFEE